MNLPPDPPPPGDPSPDEPVIDLCGPCDVPLTYAGDLNDKAYVRGLLLCHDLRSGGCLHPCGKMLSAECNRVVNWAFSRFKEVMGNKSGLWQHAEDVGAEHTLKLLKHWRSHWLPLWQNYWAGDGVESLAAHGNLDADVLRRGAFGVAPPPRHKLHRPFLELLDEWRLTVCPPRPPHLNIGGLLNETRNNVFNSYVRGNNRIDRRVLDGVEVPEVGVAGMDEAVRREFQAAYERAKKP